MSRIAELARTTDDLSVESVTVPQWGVTIDMKSPTGHERAAFMTRMAKAREGTEVDIELLARTEVELIIQCAHDPEDGTPAFVDTDADWLLNKSGAVIGKLSSAAFRVSGLGAEAEGNVPAVSVKTPGDGSTSDSPAS